MFIFRQLYDATSSTYTYLLADEGQAVLIDPVFEQARRDAALLRELDLRLLYTLDTHVHADHVTAAWLLQRRLGSRIALSAASGAQGADRLLQHGDRVSFGRRHLEVRATPGHTDGCVSYVLDDQQMAFTGDTLLIRGCGRTDFQQGSAERLFRSVHGQLFTLPAGCLLYPGHDYRGITASSVAEERRHNPRLGGEADLGDFTGYMQHLGLPHPKLIDQAVPANLRCGRPADGALPPPEPGWAPLAYTFAGLWEIEPDALAESAARVQIVDVREAAERNDALGHIPGSLALPMAELEARRAELATDRPIVTVCRSGTRSAQACLLLQRAGHTRVANLSGGMLRWRAQARAVHGETA
ncbi:MBL fold metallo-hydrolase [Rubrivivax rivuli]|uniref:MBL fold metallo-hydrolase n=1 Tax=Rubrivivax rivuli TaxID=1862385 RepID=A0A437R975_9BURK|nr:MBL fold metallo-hydrolase [Rubrivivax rivuli]RVU43330.1 MBL fold metallo-hydrolase [Rubrivivax rivuli]